MQRGLQYLVCHSVCLSVCLHPSLRPMAILKHSSSIQRPKEEIGGAFSHAPVSLVETARRQALDLASLAVESSDTALSCILGASHSFCLKEAGGVGEEHQDQLPIGNVPPPSPGRECCGDSGGGFGGLERSSQKGG